MVLFMSVLLEVMQRLPWLRADNLRISDTLHNPEAPQLHRVARTRHLVAHQANPCRTLA
jgi:hypothetical protein